MNRIKIAACCLALAVGLVSGASASLFAQCKATGATITITGINSPNREFKVDYPTTCNAGEAASCVVTLVVQVWYWSPATSAWVDLGDSTLQTAGLRCSGVTNKTKDVWITGPGLYQIDVTVEDNSTPYVVLATKSAQHTFP